MTVPLFDDVQFWHWLALGGVLGVLEILAPGFVLIWLGLAAILVGLILLAWQDMPFAYQILAFAGFSVASVLVWFYWLRRNPVESDKSTLNRRAEQLIGRRAPVIDAIVNGRGRIKLGDGTWSVTGPDLPAGHMVEITGAEGPLLHVKPAKESPPNG
ncbi:MAG: NfeD family protein [Alphaproteobacteria bacterium]|nr:NfeD family protein [Alphaproteobacteria bacterium]